MDKDRFSIRIITLLLALAIALPVPALAADGSDASAEPAAEQPAVTETVTEEPAAEEPVAEEPVAEEPAEEPPVWKINFDDSTYRTLKSRSVKPKKKLGIDLAKLIRTNKGYDVVQGGCTDGKYAYYLMVSSETQKGRVLKLRIKDNKVMARSKILKTWHGNGMAYDSRRKKLVVIAREHRKQEITWIDAKTLKVTRQRNVKYDYYAGAGKDSLRYVHQRQGLAAIAYIKKYDCYIALERRYHNLIIFDPDTFQAIGFVFTEIPEKYPGTFQAMDADEKYVYLLLSSYQENPKKQPYNLIIALDWNSENMLPVVNAGEDGPFYVEKGWLCKNNGSGAPDAVLKIKTKNEAENIYHITKNGKAHFYMSEYYNRLVYDKRTKKRKYKRSGYVYDLGII